MKTFKQTNIFFGWLVFAIALVVYAITMEPTASFWDCGEFIAASYKLQVPHPPGAPLFLLIGRLFSFFSFGDVTRVAYAINLVSVIAGAFTSALLFWSISLLAQKIVKSLLDENRWRFAGAGLIGSLAYTCCDSAWFSAVEAEVYSLSSFFTAFVVWAMLRWSVIDDASRANRWLIFIFYMMGLSIGVHLLNLVALPALALIYYFRKYKPTTWGTTVTLLMSLVIIFVITELVIPGLPTMAGKFELFFVNGIGLPFGSGVVVFILVIAFGIVVAIRHSVKKNKPVLNTFLLAFAFVLIGYSSYTLVVIRSGYDPPINENAPSDVMTFVRYLKRDQYGSRPLLYGPYFTAHMRGVEEGEPIWGKGRDRYELVDHKLAARYSAKDQTIFPRIWSTEEKHQHAYRNILGLKEGVRPTFTDNMRFLFTHQVGWMYVRYFFFNFAGRESDEQDANWISPLQWFKKLPNSLAENRGRNNFYMIPFALGLVGMYFQLSRDTKNFFVVALLFLLTGVAMVVYLNSPPSEPRERDYIYAGSYYAYCVWIGFAVIAFSEWLTRVMRNRNAAVVATVICLTAPVLMLYQGWDDHNRARRFFSTDSAINDLQSCAPNAILFSGGDNDTFPQWYVQEVEGVRTDVRVIVTSYFNTEWYIRQTMRPAYESDPFPYTLTARHYREGGPNNAYLPFYDAGIKSMDLKQYLKLLKADHQGLRMQGSRNVVPSRDIVLRVDVEKVRSLKVVPPSLAHLVTSEMHLVLKEDWLELKDLAMLDILATADWTRPIYVTGTALMQFNVDLTPYVVREGNVYRILPVLNPDPGTELVNTEGSYAALTERFKFRGLDDPSVYYSDDYRRAVQNHRNTINTVAEAMIAENDTARAKALLFFNLDKMPDRAVRYDVTHLDTFRLLLALDEKVRAAEIAETLSSRADELLEYYGDNPQGKDFRLQLAIVGQLARVYYAYGEVDSAKRVEKLFLKHTAGLERGEM